MTGSTERNWRKLTRHALAPVTMLIVGLHGPADPARRTTGYGGVLPVPAPAPTSPAPAPRPETPDQQRRDHRAARGRVLYADGRAAQPVQAARVEHKVQCPERRVVQSRTSSAPNS